MNPNLPQTICTTFLVCRKMASDPQTGELVLIGLPTGHAHHRFSTAAPFAFFVRLTAGRGVYPVEVRLLDTDGETVWADGPPRPVELDAPLIYHDV